MNEAKEKTKHERDQDEKITTTGATSFRPQRELSNDDFELSSVFRVVTNGSQKGTRGSPVWNFDAMYVPLILRGRERLRSVGRKKVLRGKLLRRLLPRQVDSSGLVRKETLLICV